MTAEQLRVASQIDTAMQSLLHSGKDNMASFVAMGQHMANFKWLVDDAGLTAMDELFRRHTGLFHYAKLLEAISDGIQSGAIKLSRR